MPNHNPAQQRSFPALRVPFCEVPLDSLNVLLTTELSLHKFGLLSPRGKGSSRNKLVQKNHQTTQNRVAVASVMVLGAFVGMRRLHSVTGQQQLQVLRASCSYNSRDKRDGAMWTTMLLTAPLDGTCACYKLPYLASLPCPDFRTTYIEHARHHYFTSGHCPQCLTVLRPGILKRVIASQLSHRHSA